MNTEPKFGEKLKKIHYRIFGNFGNLDGFPASLVEEDDNMRQVQPEKKDKLRWLKYFLFFALGYCAGDGCFRGCGTRADAEDLMRYKSETQLEKTIQQESFLQQYEQNNTIEFYIPNSDLEQKLNLNKGLEVD